MSNAWIQTSSGGKICFQNPDENQITKLDDISIPLSRIPRFLGHTVEGRNISVAHHAVAVAAYMMLCLNVDDFKVLMAGLHHDDHEAFTGDLPTPLKSIPEVRDAYRPIADRLQAMVHRRIGLPEKLDETTEAVIKRADKAVLHWEATRFMAPITTVTNVSDTEGTVTHIGMAPWVDRSYYTDGVDYGDLKAFEDFALDHYKLNEDAARDSYNNTHARYVTAINKKLPNYIDFGEVDWV